MLLAVWPHLAVVCLRSRSRLASSVASASERTLRRALAINAALQRQRCTVGAQLLQHAALRAAACFAVLHVCAVAAPSSAASAEDRAHARLHAVVRGSVLCAARSSSAQDVVPKRCVPMRCMGSLRSQSVGRHRVGILRRGRSINGSGPCPARCARSSAHLLLLSLSWYVWMVAMGPLTISALKCRNTAHACARACTCLHVRACVQWRREMPWGVSRRRDESVEAKGAAEQEAGECECAGGRK
jgi:hypothetical protein